jgi:hypothetical protein
VVFDEFPVLWGGVSLYITPRIEYLPSSQIDTSDASVVLSGEVYQEDIALIIQNQNKYLINSNVIHLEASYILSELISGPLTAPAIADIAIANGRAIIFAEYDTEIGINLPWAGMTHVTRYDPQGNKILDVDIDLGGHFSSTLMRGEFVMLVLLWLPGDVNGDRTVDIADVIFLINYLFIGGAAPEPLQAGDANCDEMVDIADVVYLINYLFIGGSPPGCG